MQTFLEIVLGWIVLSCTVGPLLAWMFFYSKREARAEREGRRSREEVRAGLGEADEGAALV